MKTFFIALFILVAGFAQAKSNSEETKTVMGKVNEVVNGKVQPVALAYVFVENTDICTYTEEDGSYKLELPKGKYEVKVVFKGYEAESKLVNTGKADTLDFIMTQSNNGLVVK